MNLLNKQVKRADAHEQVDNLDLVNEQTQDEQPVEACTARAVASWIGRKLFFGYDSYGAFNRAVARVQKCIDYHLEHKNPLTEKLRVTEETLGHTVGDLNDALEKINIHKETIQNMRKALLLCRTLKAHIPKDTPDYIELVIALKGTVGA